MKKYLDALVRYALSCGLIEEADAIYAYNALLAVMGLDCAAGEGELPELPLSDILAALTDDAVKRGLVDDSITARDLFDTRLMGTLTPFPREVRRTFAALYARSPESATDWYYRFSQDTNYIRRDRIAKDVRWQYEGKYGTLDISINLSKPEKIYCGNANLMYALASRVSIGTVRETLFFDQVRKDHKVVYIKTKDGKDIELDKKYTV